MNEKKWTKLKSKLFLRTPFFAIVKRVFRTTTGKIKDYYMIKKSSSVHIAGMTEAGKVILIKLYRPGVNGISIELPAGYVKHGESIKNACYRELLEETGYSAKRLIQFCNFTIDSSRFVGYPFYLFGAFNLSKRTNVRLGKDAMEEAKEIEVIEVDLAEALLMIKNGEIKELPTIAGIYFLNSLMVK
jgi:ADP-ribose pyrophosphatase